MVTDKADTTKKGPTIADKAADHPAKTALHHLGEADIQTAQPDTIHTTSRDTDEVPHHTTSTPLQQSRNPM